MSYSRRPLGGYAKSLLNNTKVTQGNILIENEISFNIVSGDVIAEREDIVNNRDDKILTPLRLTYALEKSSPIGNVSPNSGAFTTLTTTTPISSSSGGTGFKTYTKGDILVADDTNVLTRLPIGSNTQVLTADSSLDIGLKWANPSNNLPEGYTDIGDPYIYYVGQSLSYIIPYCLTRSYDNSVDIIINQPHVLSTSNNVPNGVSMSGVLGSDATSSDTTVSAFDIHLKFNVGQTISINGEVRTVLSMGTDTLIINIPFSSDITTPSDYYRGGFVPSSYYYLYAIYGEQESPAYLLYSHSYCRTAYNPDLPNGYTTFRELWPIFWVDANGDFVPLSYFNRRILSYYDLLDSAASTMYNVPIANHIHNPGQPPISLSYGYNSNMGSVFSIPSTMGNIYLQNDSNTSVDSSIPFTNYGFTECIPDYTSISTLDAESGGRITLIGGIVNRLTPNLYASS